MSKIKFDYLGKDYEAFRTQMINNIPHVLPEWTDYLQSDPGITLIELFAYGLDVLSYYQDRIANELYLPTAQLRQSVIDYVRPLGYVMREARPADTFVVFEISSGEELQIPKGYRVTTKAEGTANPIPFETAEHLVIPDGDNGLEQEGGEYIHKVKVVNGVTIKNEVIGSSTGLPNQVYKLRYPNVTQIDEELQIQVDEGQGFVTWEKKDELIVDVGVPIEDRKFYRIETDADNFTWIRFGSGVDGKVPNEGVDNIRATYRVGGGKHTNVGSNTITELPVQLNRVKAVFNPDPAENGENKESIEEAKTRMPITLYTRRRAVTRTDFEQIALLVPGVLKTKAEYIKAANTAMIPIIVKEWYNDDAVREETYNYIDDRKLLGVEHEVYLADPYYLDIKLTAFIGDEHDPDIVENTIVEVLEDTFAEDSEETQFGDPVKKFQVFSILSGIAAVKNIEIDKLTTIPKLIETDLSTNGEFYVTDGLVKESNTTTGYWKIIMTSATAFDVEFDSTGEFDGGEVSKGSGELGSQFTSTGDEIDLMVNGDNLQIGDTAIIKAFKYKGDIEVDKRDIILYGVSEVTVEGGV